MSGFTPGPWEFVPFKAHEYSSRKEGDMGGFRTSTGWVCHFGDSTTYYPAEGVPPNEQDARLIAAAPRMYSRIEILAADGDMEAKEIMEAVNGRA